MLAGKEAVIEDIKDCGFTRVAGARDHIHLVGKKRQGPGFTTGQPEMKAFDMEFHSSILALR